jgi:hypothetical protein
MRTQARIGGRGQVNTTHSHPCHSRSAIDSRSWSCAATERPGMEPSHGIDIVIKLLDTLRFRYRAKRPFFGSSQDYACSTRTAFKRMNNTSHIPSVKIYPSKYPSNSLIRAIATCAVWTPVSEALPASTSPASDRSGVVIGSRLVALLISVRAGWPKLFFDSESIDWNDDEVHRWQRLLRTILPTL